MGFFFTNFYSSVKGPVIYSSKWETQMSFSEPDSIYFCVA